MVPREAGTKVRLEMDSLAQVYDRLDKMHTALSAAGSGEAYDVGLMDGIAVARQYVRRAMIDRARVTEAEAEAVWPGIGAEVDARRGEAGRHLTDEWPETDRPDDCVCPRFLTDRHGRHHAWCPVNARATADRQTADRQTAGIIDGSESVDAGRDWVDEPAGFYENAE